MWRKPTAYLTVCPDWNCFKDRFSKLPNSNRINLLNNNHDGSPRLILTENKTHDQVAENGHKTTKLCFNSKYFLSHSFYSSHGFIFSDQAHAVYIQQIQTGKICNIYNKLQMFLLRTIKESFDILSFCVDCKTIQ